MSRKQKQVTVHLQDGSDHKRMIEDGGMRIAIVVFTFRGDEALVHKNLEHIEILRSLNSEHEIHCFVVDDANCPFIDPVEETPLTHYLQTTYNRGGNLRGWENITGQLGTLFDIEEKYNFDYILKADSDTCIMNLATLKCGIDYGGTSASPEQQYGWGSVYFLSRKSLSQLKENFNESNENVINIRRAIQEHRLFGGEDVVTGTLVRQLCKDIKIEIGRLSGVDNLVPFEHFKRVNKWCLGVATKPGANFLGVSVDAERKVDRILMRMEICKRILLGEHPKRTLEAEALEKAAEPK